MAAPFIAGTRNAERGLAEGRRILEAGGSAPDAVEAAIRVSEDDAMDWTVGYDGLPNLLGDVELDASIMLGSSRKAGAVAGVRTVRNPITLARRVMEESPHVLLVGEGADRFARAVGMGSESLQSEAGRRRYENIMAGRELLEGLGRVPEEMSVLAWRYGPYLKRQMRQFDAKGWYARIGKTWHGTVDVIAGDRRRELCCGVSTSGLALKLPGRAGDTPVIGAGNYADARYGAAACVGQGELAIRICAARQAVDLLADGRSPRQAAAAVIRDALRVDRRAILQVLVADPAGRVAAAASQRDLHTVFWRQGMADVERRPSQRIRAR